MDDAAQAHSSFVTKPPFPPCAFLLLTCPVTPLSSWVLRGAARLPPSAQRIQRKGLPQPVTKLDLKQMFKYLALSTILHASEPGLVSLTHGLHFQSFARLVCGDEEGEGCYQLLEDKIQSCSL